jgi:uncharacterized membrane protein
LTYADLIDAVVRGFELLGGAVLVVGLVWSVWLAIRAWRADDGSRGYHVLRQAFGSVLLLGLEFLVAADLIRTVAVEPNLRNVTSLGLIVLIRTFLSFSLQVEIEGVVPWRRALTTTGAGAVTRAARAGKVESGEG